jgi:CheY-like chemotaxis protein
MFSSAIAKESWVMTRDATYRILIVDDDAEIVEDLQELLKEELEDLGEIHFETEQDFSAAEERLTRSNYDLVVLDVRDAANRGPLADVEARGRELYERIAKIRWVPVVFFTGVPQQVRVLEKAPLVAVVTKNDIDSVAPAVRKGLLSDVSTLTRRISGLVEGYVREFMRDVVAPHWEEMAGADQDEIALVIINRLAAWLREDGLRALDSTVESDIVKMPGQPSAARVYLIPPVTHHLTATDLLLDPEDGWWLVLTPACDLYEDPPSANVPKPRTAKAQFVRLAKADRMFTDGASGSESPAIATWLASAKSRRDKDQVKRVFRSDDNRYRALPRFLDVPDLVIDFENVRSIELSEVRTWKRVATLDSPFAEAMLTSYSRSVGRVGTPDISFDAVESQLLTQIQPAVPPTQMPAGTPSSEVPKG